MHKYDNVLMGKLHIEMCCFLNDYTTRKDVAHKAEANRSFHVKYVLQKKKLSRVRGSFVKVVSVS